MEARAGFDWNLITKSDREEKTATHIVVGRLMGFHEIKVEAYQGLRPPLARFVAAIAVANVEKGEGIVPGSWIYIHFSSPRTQEQLESERISSGCGDERLDPRPGEDLRVYFRLNENYEYVADYPRCFFYIGRSEPKQGLGTLLASSRNLVVGMMVAFSAVVGFAAGAVLRSTRRGPLGPVRPQASDAASEHGSRSADQPIGTKTDPAPNQWIPPIDEEISAR
jgi:hypothetical protein